LVGALKPAPGLSLIFEPGDPDAVPVE
jgi:hypothetical protein